ncbi:MAG: RecX family transcriptional regulator [Dehalococcoidales bacterium]
MSKITALRPADRFKQRQKVFLDGKFAFSLTAEVAARADLKVGQEMDNDHVDALIRQDRYHRSLNQALRYLSYRPRSEAELKEKLGRQGISPAEIETITVRLRAEGLINDDSFAQFWKENRQSFRPRSQRLLRLELKHKGIPDDIIEGVVGEINDTESAYHAALDKARRLELIDYQLFRQRLGSYLRRRGFDYGVINSTVARIWQETGK